MSVSFKIGQRVACIDDDWHPEECVFHCPRLPIKGDVYKILGFNPVLPEVFLYLEGMPDEWCFRSDHFRPLVENKTETDISVFEKLLVPMRERERETVS